MMLTLWKEEKENLKMITKPKTNKRITNRNNKRITKDDESCFDVPSFDPLKR